MRVALVVLALAFGGCCCPQTRCCDAPPQIVPAPRAVAAPPAPTVAPPTPLPTPTISIPTPTVENPCADLPYVVPFALGTSNLQSGDAVTILEVKGDRATLEVGGSYCVRGRYTLASKPSANLCLWSTDGDTQGTDAERCKPVSLGSGEFVLRFRSVTGRLGAPHVSFYGASDGQGFGGVYFSAPPAR